jgi:hypothetical protein
MDRRNKQLAAVRVRCERESRGGGDPVEILVGWSPPIPFASSAFVGLAISYFYWADPHVAPRRPQWG